MTPGKVIELAKQAGFQARGDVIRTMHSSGAWVGINGELQRFAELVLAEAECGSGAGCLYKEAQIAALEEKLALVRNAALEDAAKAIDKMANDTKATMQQQFAIDIASDAIRGLKS